MNRKMLHALLAAGLIIGTGCSEEIRVINGDPGSEQNTPPLFTATPLKWYGGRTSALSMTYDGVWGLNDDINVMTDEVIARGLPIDHEVVTATYERYPEVVAKMRDEAIPNGVHFFGHGHHHDLHDSLSYEECYTSFRTCYLLMEEWGLKPRAYAYPGSSAYEVITQLANKQAGFICARGAELDRDRIFICPNDVTEPEKWHYLPSLVMGTNYDEYVHTHEELMPSVLTNIEKTSWLILMYHAIGIEGAWGYYPSEEFIADIDYFAAHADKDIWVGNMDMVACYIQERNRFYIDVDYTGYADEGSVRVRFCDGLDNAIYTQPLTIDLTAASEDLYQSLHVEPAIDGKHYFPFVDNTVRLDVLPDEQPYTLTFIPF